MKIQALIQAAGQGTRLGRGPKAFVMLRGRTLLEHAVDLFRSVADDIIVAAPRDHLDRARDLVGGSGIQVIAGGDSRSQTTRYLIAAATAPWLFLHDVVHPLAGPGLLAAVLAAARQHGVAAPAITNTEFMYDRAGRPLHAPEEVLIGQKPVAFSRATVTAAYAAAPHGSGTDPSLMELLEAAGIRTHFVEGSSTNIKITRPADLDLAAALLALSAREPD